MSNVDASLAKALGELSTIQSYYAKLEDQTADRRQRPKPSAKIQTAGLRHDVPAKAGEVVTFYQREKGNLSLEDRLQLAETCLSKLYTLNQSLAQELAVFKVVPHNSIERLLLDPTHSSLTLSMRRTPAKTGTRTRTATGHSPPTRAQTAEKPRNGRRSAGRAREIDTLAGGNSRRSDANDFGKERLIRTFNLQLQHAEREACDSNAREAALRQQLESLQKKYGHIEARLKELGCCHNDKQDSHQDTRTASDDFLH